MTARHTRERAAIQRKTELLREARDALFALAETLSYCPDGTPAVTLVNIPFGRLRDLATLLPKLTAALAAPEPAVLAETARAWTNEEMEELICDCGAGHGSLEGHVDWCKWFHVAPRRAFPNE